jgi:hypothetical protein
MHTVVWSERSLLPALSSPGCALSWKEMCLVQNEVDLASYGRAVNEAFLTYRDSDIGCGAGRQMSQSVGPLTTRFVYIGMRFYKLQCWSDSLETVLILPSVV